MKLAVIAAYSAVLLLLGVAAAVAAAASRPCVSTAFCLATATAEMLSIFPPPELLGCRCYLHAAFLFFFLVRLILIAVPPPRSPI